MDVIVLLLLILQLIIVLLHTLNINDCNSYYWDVNDTTFTESGIYVFTFSNILGCDSVVVLDLIINNSNSGITIISCNSILGMIVFIHYLDFMKIL